MVQFGSHGEHEKDMQKRESFQNVRFFNISPS